jgi:hypothetical protein
MVARLEIYIQRCALRALAGFAKRNYFSVRLAGARVIAFADNLIVADDDCSHHRIGLRLSPSKPRQLESSRHVTLVVRRLSR